MDDKDSMMDESGYTPTKWEHVKDGAGVPP